MRLPKNYKPCQNEPCEGIYNSSKTPQIPFCRRCYEALTARELRMGLGEPPTEKAGGGFRVIKKLSSGGK